MDMRTVEASLDSAGFFQLDVDLRVSGEIVSRRHVDDVVGISFRYPDRFLLGHHDHDVLRSGLSGLVAYVRMLQVTGFQPLVEDLGVGRFGELRIFRPRILSFRSGLPGLGPQGVGFRLSNEIDELVIRMSHGLKRPYFVVFLDFDDLRFDHRFQYHIGIITRFRIRSFENEEFRQCVS